MADRPNWAARIDCMTTERHPRETILDLKIEHMQSDLSEIKDRMTKLEDRQQAFEARDAKRERNQLVWGISFLGGVVVVLGSLVWSHLPSIVNGNGK
jgi:hypothetical protein